MDELVEIGLDLSVASLEAIDLFLDQAEDQDFYMEIFEACKARPDALKLIVEHENTPDDIRALAARAINVAVPTVKAVKPPVPEEEKQQSLMKQISLLGISQKIRLAQKGGSQARNVLAKESNKLVVMAVLGNPKITDSEVEAMARNRSIIEDALRLIGKRKEWMKSYAVRLALISNPKTPVGISMPFMAGLKKKDLSNLEKNKNVPEAVRVTAKKLVKGGKAS